MTDLGLWGVTLAMGALVVIVVAVLLTAILRAARRISARLDEIWTAGQGVANDTAHLDLLRRSSVVTEDILASLDLSAENATKARSERM